MTGTAQTRTLSVEPADYRTISAFGELVGPDPAAAPAPSVFYPGTATYGFGEFSSDEDTVLILSRVQPRPLAVQYLERHFKHTQTFIPLGGKPFVMVLAPPDGGDAPDLDQVRAFSFDGTAAMCLRVGCWHEFPFALQPDTDLISILRDETYRAVGQSDERGEAHGPDIDKQDVVARQGVRFELGPIG
jgi:ureidoglycolate lyase